MGKSAASRKVLVAGLANSGKTTLCNRLTGTYSLVANYPMTTVEPRTESYSFGGTVYEVTDMPGLNGLLANSEEELVMRRLLAENPPDVLVQCVDANRLKQSLYLTAELLGLELPMVICLTAVDETARTGRKINSSRLSQLTGIPVVETGMPGRRGMYDVREAIAEAAVPDPPFRHSAEIEGAVEEIQRAAAEAAAEHPSAGVRKAASSEGTEPDSRHEEIWETSSGSEASRGSGSHRPFARAQALLVLMGDPCLTEISETVDKHSRRKESFRYWGLAPAVRRKMTETAALWYDKLPGRPADQIVRERGRWIDMITRQISEESGLRAGTAARRAAYASRHPIWGFLILAGILSAAYFLVVEAAGFAAETLEELIASPIVEYLQQTIGTPFLVELLVGDYGLLTLGLFNAVLTVLPILTLFFFLLGFLEDIGYLPNLSVLMRRFFSRLGLSGKAVMPIILGFGCKTMATMTTRSLKSRKERLIAIYLIAFAIPCSAQLGLNFAILGRAGFSAFILAFTVLLLVELAAGIVLNRIIRSDTRPAFIQELPPFRTPSLREIFRKTGWRVWWFLKEAIPIFIIAAAVIFLFDLIGLLDLIKKLLDPLVVAWLGLPIEFVDALVLMLAREEAAAGLILRLSREGMLDYMQSVIAVVVTTMFVPCFANIVAMFKEAGVRAAVLMLIGINLSTVLLGGLLNHGARLAAALFG